MTRVHAIALGSVRHGRLGVSSRKSVDRSPDLPSFHALRGVIDRKCYLERRMHRPWRKRGS